MANEVLLEQLRQRAVAARALAYCPYSNFRVGAALLCDDGTIYTGVNVENACYGLTVCAERVALMNAVSSGHRKFTAMAICCDVKDSFKASCGSCRQFMYEFTEELDMYLVKPDMTSKKVQLSELLPDAFGPKTLQEERCSR